MGSAWQDEVSPAYLREDRIQVTLDTSITEVEASVSCLLNVDYSACDPQGVVLPLIFEVRGPSDSSYQRREFKTRAPTSIVFTPREGGPHSVTLREAAHNRWFGSLHLDVVGDELEAGSPT